MTRTTDTETIRVARSFKRQLDREKQRLQEVGEQNETITLIGITERLFIVPQTGKAQLRPKKP